MPKVNIPTKANRLAGAVKTMQSISKLMRVNYPSCRVFAQALGVSVPTASSRLSSPETITLNELAAITIGAGISCDICLKKDDIQVDLHW